MMNELKRHKAGIFIGAITGAIAAAYAVSQGYADITSIASAGQGFIDNLFAREAPTTIATYKVYVVFVTVGAIVGYVADYIIMRTR
jgi:hypothetical protein